MNYPELDVLVLTYNRANYLKIALEAIFNSIASWRKTIIVNNASTDNTLEVIEQMRINYPNRIIEVVNNSKNLGNTGNFFRSQEIADNKYVAIFHDDDAIHPEYIDRAMKIMRNDKDLVMISGGEVAMYSVSANDWYPLPNSYLEYPVHNNAFLSLMLRRSTFASAIYKTDVYVKTKYRPDKYGKLHDIIFLLDIGALGKVAFINDGCVRWRMHASSDSNCLKTGPFPDEVYNTIYSINNIFRRENNSKGFRGGIKNILYKSALFNFSYFLYRWSDCKRYVTWTEFKNELYKRKVFSLKEYFLFDKCINFILNPAIRYYARKGYVKYVKIYEYRVGEK